MERTCETCIHYPVCKHNIDLIYIYGKESPAAHCKTYTDLEMFKNEHGLTDKLKI